MAKIYSIILLLLTINTALAAQGILIPTLSNTGITPGKTGYVTINLKNTGLDVAYNTRIVMTSLDAPLQSNHTCNDCTEYSSTQKVCLNYQDYCYTTLGDISAGDTKNANFKINVPYNTPTNNYEARFIIYYESYNITTNTLVKTKVEASNIINITSKTTKPDINVIQTTLNPESISPGDEFNITFLIENAGEITARDIKLALSTTNFKVKGSTSKIALNDIESNNKTNVTFTLLSDASLIPGVYDLQININYSDNDATYTATSSTGVLIDGGTNFNVFIQDITPDIITKDTLINALISVANTGVINAKSVSIKINPSSDIEVGNINQDFLGELNTGDFTTTSFKFTPLKEGELNIGLTIEYLTPSGTTETFNKTEKIIIRYSVTEAISQTPSINALDIILIGAVIALTIYIFNKRKSKK